jgi:hypothetical protein
MLAVIAVLCGGFALVSRWPLVGSAAMTLVTSVAIFATLTTWASKPFARAICETGQFVGICANLPVLVLAFLTGLIGLAQGTDTSVRENDLIAVVGLSLAGIALVTYLALFVSRRSVFGWLFAAACVANASLLVGALYHVTAGASAPGSIAAAATLYGLALVSTNALAIKLAYRNRWG